ncbi:hypothetical protein M0Q50_03815 [bacterium]|nr:hypothetical protein [bacterium]
MKTGDKLLCKRSFKQLIKDKIYKIKYIDNSYIHVENVGYFTTNMNNASFENYIWTYFYKTEELRKKKLDSI